MIDELLGGEVGFSRAWRTHDKYFLLGKSMNFVILLPKEFD